MNKAAPFDDVWVRHLAQTYSLDESLVRRLGEEFLDVTGATVTEFVTRTHLRYQEQGLRNQEIFERLAEDIACRRFRVEPPTARQLRRMIYG